MCNCGALMALFTRVALELYELSILADQAGRRIQTFLFKHNLLAFKILLFLYYQYAYRKLALFHSWRQFREMR